MTLDLYDVIKRPVITEKSNQMAANHRQFTFEVDPRANKIQIKEAVEVIFNVDVIQVTTMVMPIKRSRRGRKYYVRAPEWKKAIVTLPVGQTIPLFNV
jgi:large subunit ribosomal protein L23